MVNEIITAPRLASPASTAKVETVHPQYFQFKSIFDLFESHGTGETYSPYVVVRSNFRSLTSDKEIAHEVVSF